MSALSLLLFFSLVWKKLYNTNVYETKEHVCSDICCVSLSSEHDECLSGLHNCDENALCFNMVGGHSCSCKPGYTGNGTVCKGKHHHVDSVICCVMLIQVPKQDIKNAVAVVNHVRRELTLHWKQIFLSSVSGSTIKSDTKNKTKTKTQLI